MKSSSYIKSKCCGEQDCDYLDDKEDEPCWGQVEEISFSNEKGHLCQGHINKYSYDNPSCQYIKENKYI